MRPELEQHKAKSMKIISSGLAITATILAPQIRELMAASHLKGYVA